MEFRRRALRAMPRLVPLLALASCVGVIGDGSASPDPGAPPVPDGRRGAATTFTPAGGGLQRLTSTQYRNTVRDLLGADVAIPAALPPDPQRDEGVSFANVGAGEVITEPLGVEQYTAAGEVLAEQLFADPGRRAALVGCEPERADAPCVRAFLADFGRRAWRRPLTPAELDRYLGVARAAATELGGDVWGGLELAVAGLLASPHFVYRVEVGEPAPERPGWRRYTGYEMAARLSYLIWDTAPDAALLDAAASGALATREGVRAAATRLLEAGRARPALLRFFADLFGLQGLDQLSKNAEAFPQFTPTLGPAMRGEIERLLEDLVFERDADFMTVFETRETFVNRELAALYGLPPVTSDGYVRVTIPADWERAGLLGTGGLLALNARETMTSPTLRGLFIRERLLCRHVPPPPPSVNATLPPSTGPETTRQRLARHRTDPACSGCHNLMDPLGYGLEHFDGIGAHRQTEIGMAIDASGELDGVAFTGAPSLGAALARHPGVAACLVRQYYQHATGHEPTRAEQPQLDALAREFDAAGHRIKRLVLAVVESDGFRYAGEPR